MARDNFSKHVIETLKARVSLRCSNPDCRVPTSAPSSNDKVNNIGIAAHICAASPGGPRYNDSMTTEERKSLHNAIWLCANCSIDIDKDVGLYTVELLKRWKDSAEKAARSEQGRKLPCNTEIIDTVATTLTGYPKSYLSNAISNVHLASAKSLESLDPRFTIRTAYTAGSTTIGIHAKEDVSLSMSISQEYMKEYLEKHRQLIEHGRDVEISLSAIKIEGSKLFEELFRNEKGTFSISTTKIKAIQKLWLVNKETHQIESFDDIHGEISLGTESIWFKGVACAELFALYYQRSLNAMNDKANLSISISFENWENTELRLLPYFVKLSSLFEKMSLGWELFTTLEVNGASILSSTGLNLSNWRYAIDIHNILSYINSCRIISERLKVDIKFISNTSYSAEQHNYISEVAELFEDKKVYTVQNLTSNATCKLEIDETCKAIKTLTEMKTPTTIKIIQQDEVVEIFGINVELPPKAFTLECVLPKIYGEIKRLRGGDVVTVEWLPQKNFKCIVSYEF